MKQKNLPTLGNSTNVILLLNSKLCRQLSVHSTMLTSIIKHPPAQKQSKAWCVDVLQQLENFIEILYC